MNRKEFTEKLTSLVNTYIENFDRFDSNPQIRIFPDTLDMALVNGDELADSVEDNDEALENAAAAHGMANQDAMEMQTEHNPDYYSVKRLLKSDRDTSIADAEAIRAVASGYF